MANKSPAERLQDIAKETDKRADNNYNLATFLIAAGAAGAIGLGIGLAKDNTELTYSGLAMGGWAAAPFLYRRASYDRRRSEVLYDQASAACQSETWSSGGEVDAAQLHTVVSLRLPAALREILLDAETLRTLINPDNTEDRQLQLPPQDPAHAEREHGPDGPPVNQVIT